MHGGGRDDLGANLFGSMWQPANKAALPSQGETIFAKKAISELELELENAYELPEQMRSRISKLTTDLAERKAWIAPIRKIPVEILSEIFIFASGLEDLAPMTIMEVCRLWHTVVLSTPRAWSVIYARGIMHGPHLRPYVSTFLERSRPCLLHISIPFGVDEDKDGHESDPSIPPALRLTSHLSRIQCLFIPSGKLAMIRQANMPNLTRLKLVNTGRGEMIKPFFINQFQFPRLQSVDCTCFFWAKSLPFTWFPPLQYLAIRMDADFTSLEVGRNCANTLKSLQLTLYERIQLSHTLTIVFPKLENLEIEDHSGNTSNAPWMLQMSTPALTSYKEISSRESACESVHGDVKDVVTLQSNRIHDLSNYVNLRVYQLVRSPRSKALANELAEQLDQNLNTCPALQMVLFYVSGDSTFDSTKNSIIGSIKNARPGVEVVVTKQFCPFTEFMEENSCARDMPCRAYR